MDKLQKSRQNMDNMLAEHNGSFMQVQKETRQQFITDCEARIRDLPDSVRSTVVAMLLSSEDFAVDMNFSELHTSKGKSSLAWSCTDASLSDPSWKIRESAKFGGLSGGCSDTDDGSHDTVLQQCAEDTAASSSAGKLARTTRSITKGSSPRVPPSTPITERVGGPTSTTPPQAGMDSDDELIEDEDNDEDLISTAEVTIPKPRRTKVQESPAALAMHEPRPTRERHCLARSSQETSKKRSSSRRGLWSQPECDTLKDLCDGKEEGLHHQLRSFWGPVSAQLPGRSPRACFMKWQDMRAGPRPRKTTTAGCSESRGRGARRGRWSAGELKKLAQYCSRPGRPRNWAAIAARFPGRSIQACCNQYYKGRTRVNGVEEPMEAKSQGSQASEAEDTTSDEPEEENPGGQEAGGGTRMSSDGMGLVEL